VGQAFDGNTLKKKQDNRYKAKELPIFRLRYSRLSLLFRFTQPVENMLALTHVRHSVSSPEPVIAVRFVLKKPLSA
jgi:hypothetical protein